MPGFSSYDDIISQITVNGYATDYDGFKVIATAPLANVWHSAWTDIGIPGAGSNPAATPGTVHDGTSTNNFGGITFANVSTQSRYLLSFGAVANIGCNLMLVDRLVGVSGLSTTTTGNKTVSSSALPTRYSTGAGVQAWLECTTLMTGTVPHITLNSYTNQANTAAQSGGALTLPGLMKVGDMCAMPVQAGDSGVRAVSTINVGTNSSAGVVNLVLVKPLAYLNIPAGVWNEKDCVMQIPSLPQIYDAACLQVLYQPISGSASTIYFKIRTAYK